MDEFLLSLLVLLLVAASIGATLYLWANALPRRETVWDWEPALLVEDGKIVRRLPAGRYRVTAPEPLFGAQRAILRLPAGERTVTTATQEVMTRDKLQVKAVATLRYVVDDLELAAASAAPGGAISAGGGAVARTLEELLYDDAQLALRRVLGAVSLEDALSDRAGLDAALTDALSAAAKRYGLALLSAGARDVILGASLRRAYEQAETARLEAGAALERARGETAALRSLANAARLTKENPALLSLRLLQTLEQEDGAKVTLILGRDGLASGSEGGDA